MQQGFCRQESLESKKEKDTRPGTVWASGYNRKIQAKHHEMVKHKNIEYEIASNPMRVDYILKLVIASLQNYDTTNDLCTDISNKTAEFVTNIKYLF